MKPTKLFEFVYEAGPSVLRTVQVTGGAAKSRTTDIRGALERLLAKHFGRENDAKILLWFRGEARAALCGAMVVAASGMADDAYEAAFAEIGDVVRTWAAMNFGRDVAFETKVVRRSAPSKLDIEEPAR